MYNTNDNLLHDDQLLVVPWYTMVLWLITLGMTTNQVVGFVEEEPYAAVVACAVRRCRLNTSG